MVDTSTEAVERLLDGVTPGPWTLRLAYDDDRAVIDGTGFPVAYDVASADRRFIATARDLVPALLAERDALAAAKWSAEADVARRLEMHECAMAERDDCIEDWSKANDRIKALEGALGWYAEQTSLCRLIHSEGDVGRNALANDGGDRARAALAASRAASDCQQRDLVIAEAAQPVTVPEIKALIDAAKALHIDMLERAECRMDTIRGKKYRIVNSGRTAWANFDAALRAIAEGR